MPTVQQFANELKIPVEELLNILRRSSIVGKNKRNAIRVSNLKPSSHLQSEDISKLLEYLRLRKKYRDKEEKRLKQQPPLTADRLSIVSSPPEATLFDRSVKMTTKSASKFAKGD